MEQLPEEVLKILSEMKQKEENEFKEIKKQVEQLHKGEWDVKKDDPIPFFDTTLSYEITGYRPIDQDHGLDFDPSWFTEAREGFLKNGHYTLAKKNTKAFKDFWHQQYIYCRDGMTVNGYTITGNHYFFLNFYQLPNPNVEKAGTSRALVFPQFLVYQYEYFHYYELCKYLRKNVALMKSRGIGFSEINAAVMANQYNSFRGSNTILSATTQNYVDTTIQKVWDALSFLNDNTDGGFKKLTQVSNSRYQKRASFLKKVNGQEVEVGWKSQITAIVADRSSKVRGQRTDLFVMEEAGHNKELLTQLVKATALVTLGAQKVGVISLGGTGGDEGAMLEGLRVVSFNPEVYDVLPFKNTYTEDGSVMYTAFFIPCYKAVYQENYIDERGYCDEVKAKEYYDKERAQRSSSPKALLDYCAEYCYTLEEAFSKEGVNQFNKAILAAQLTRIRAMHQCPHIDEGMFKFQYKSGDHEFNSANITDVIWQNIRSGKVQILEHPLWIPQKSFIVNENGEREEVQKEVIPMQQSLYVAGIDSIDLGQEDTSSETRDASQFCMVIYRRAYGMKPPQFVAMYKDRPEKLKQAFQTAIALAMYYNCQINLEATRISLLSFARSNKFLRYFMHRPSATYPDITKKRTNSYGTPATTSIINHQNDLIADYIEEYGENMWFEEMIEQLSQYTFEFKRKFDCVAACGMAMLADEELSGVVPKAVKQEANNDFRDIGFYYDENGVKHWGAIPKKREVKVNFTNNFNMDDYGYGLVKTSDPRYYF